jgi:Tfp pilus assembly protein PilN
MTSEQIPERRPAKIDLDLLPSEYKPSKLLRLNFILVLAAIVLAGLIAPFVILEVNASSQIDSLEDTLSLRNAELNELYTEQAEAVALEAQIDAADNKLNSMEQDYQTFLQELVLWSEIIDEIDDLLPGSITLSSITQSGSEITLVGSTGDIETLNDYALELEESDYFSSATIKAVTCPGVTDCEFTLDIELSGAEGQ